MHEFRVQWALERQKAMQIDLSTLDRNPRATDTTLAEPWRTILVPNRRLESLKYHDYPAPTGLGPLWGIGECRPVSNCNPIDVNPDAIDSERQTRRPGVYSYQGRFDRVVRGAYGNRNFKYLYALDHRGMHIAREMTPCKASSRGIITHSILVDRGAAAGEIFFDLDDAGKVYVNYGSARIPIEDVWQAEKVAEFVLALGYHTVVAMIPDRDLKKHPYGMGDRYGKDVENLVFKRETEAP
ncbi:MAG: hypothetical protein NBV65_04070 [Burkholderiaceae bacterium]|nr:hypothetical protein [Burkholderiaceae bacterium]